MRVTKRFGAAFVVAAVLVSAAGATTAFADDSVSTETPVVSVQPTEVAPPPAEEVPQEEPAPPQETTPAPAPEEVAEEPKQEVPSEPPAEEPAPVEEQPAPPVEDPAPPAEQPVPPSNTSSETTLEDEAWTPQTTLRLYTPDCYAEGEMPVLVFSEGNFVEGEQLSLIVVDGEIVPIDAEFRVEDGVHIYSYTITNTQTGESVVVNGGTFTTEACETQPELVTPVPPTQDGNVVTIPDVEGVEYQDEGGNVLPPGDIEIDEDLTVIAVPEDGYEFEDGVDTEWTFVYTPETPETKVITAKALIDHECDASEWHFVITQTSESQAPATITVTFANGEEVVVSLGRVTGKTAHYTTMEHLDGTVVSASAEIDEGWDGQFNLSHGPCAVTPPVTYKAPEPVAIDLCGQEDDAIVIPEYDAEMGYFTLYGEKVAPGTYSVIGTTARVAFQFADGVEPEEGSFTSKVYEFTQKPCDEVPPTENPNPNPPKPTPVTPTPVPAGNGGGSDKGSSDDRLATTGADSSSLGTLALGAFGLMAMGALALLRRRSA